MNPNIFVSDSRAIEFFTGISIAVISVWCWWGEWFGNWLGQLDEHAGKEIYVAIIGGTFGLVQAWAAVRGKERQRATCCIIALFIFAALSVVTVQSRGWTPPGAPGFSIMVAVMAWCYLRIHWWTQKPR